MGEGFFLHWFSKPIEAIKLALETEDFTEDEKEMLRKVIRSKEEENK